MLLNFGNREIPSLSIHQNRGVGHSFEMCTMIRKIAQNFIWSYKKWEEEKKYSIVGEVSFQSQSSAI